MSSIDAKSLSVLVATCFVPVFDDRRHFHSLDDVGWIMIGASGAPSILDRERERQPVQRFGK